MGEAAISISGNGQITGMEKSSISWNVCTIKMSIRMPLEDTSLWVDPLPFCLRLEILVTGFGELLESFQVSVASL